MTSEQCRLIVIRHSERADDVEEVAWKKLVSENKLRGGRKCFANDPLISSKDGVLIARQMAQAVEAIMSNSHSGAVVHLYASRLLRATQTASFLSRCLNVPVQVSGGLAQIIPAVRNSKDGFEFASVAELTRYCPSVDFVDCDDMRTPENYLPTHSWRAALDTLLANSEGKNIINIVVAHRETVRKLAGEYLETPYCCLGMFAVEFPATECEGKSTDAFDEPTKAIVDESGSSTTTNVAFSLQEDGKEKISTLLGNSKNTSARADSKRTPIQTQSSSVHSSTGKKTAIVKDLQSTLLSVEPMKPKPKGRLASSECKLPSEHRVVRGS